MAIKIHPLQVRLRNNQLIGKSLPKAVTRGITSDKGLFRGACNITACQASNSAVFFNTGTNAYYCRECAEDIHYASLFPDNTWLTSRMIFLAPEAHNTNIVENNVKTLEDYEDALNARAEARMQKAWDKMIEKRNAV